jgi:hypothetical protein
MHQGLAFHAHMPAPCSQSEADFAWSLVESNGLQAEASDNAYLIINQGKCGCSALLQAVSRIKV